ncbi:hypothetical protein EDB81DRAFT_917127 [Dactylonectria macrodidyma]|uniref:Uncharacterized protein n=1 Tax=Dactylonectria macrodidyma TaxID=307937 RepID=A0A9P9JEM8_9HYPO|nr:hypothetical protein EDB81DRAFT_917127 [Dactylonectria macrodidyma]
MARRKTKKPKLALKSTFTPNLRVWSDDDRREPLAYLNWCVQSEVDFETTVIGHLKRVTGRDFSSRQVRDKLRREWNNVGKCDKFEDLYAQGTAGLNPSPEEDQLFEQILTRLGRPNVRYRLRSASSALNTRSRTVSTDIRNTQQMMDTGRLLQSAHATENVSDDEPERDHPPNMVKGEEDSELSSVASFECPDTELDASSAAAENTCRSFCASAGDVLNEATDLQVTQTELLKQKGNVFSLRNRLPEKERELNDMHHCSRAAIADQYHLRQQILNLRR